MRNLLLITLVLVVSEPATSQSRYLNNNSSGLAAFGGYLAQRDFSTGSGGFGISLVGRFDIALSYGKGTLEEDRGYGNVVRNTVTSITPSVAYYVVKATTEQPVNVGLLLSHAWVNVRELRPGGGYFGLGKESQTLLLGGDISAVFDLSPAASILPGFSFLYGIVSGDGQAVNHVTSPTVGASLGLRINVPPLAFFVLEPGIVYATQGDMGLSSGISGGLVIKPFQRRL